MRVRAFVLIAALLGFSFICSCEQGGDPSNLMLGRWRHEERMAEIEAQGRRMSEQEKAELAEMVADKVVERLNQQQQQQ